MKNAESPEMLSATTSVFDLVARLGGLIAGVTAIGYFAGSRQTSAYYRELGAPWASELLTPFQIAQASLGVLGPLLVGALLSLYLLVESATSQRGLRRWSISSFILSMLLYTAALLSEDHLSSYVCHFLIMGAALIMSFSIGFTIGELIAVLALNELKWDGYGIYLLLIIIIYGLSWAPRNWGESLGRMRVERIGSLPQAFLDSSSNAQKWRLLSPVGDKFLLISSEGDNTNRLFRLVSTDSVQAIAGTSGYGFKPINGTKP